MSKVRLSVTVTCNVFHPRASVLAQRRQGDLQCRADLAFSRGNRWFCCGGFAEISTLL